LSKNVFEILGLLGDHKKPHLAHGVLLAHEVNIIYSGDWNN